MCRLLTEGADNLESLAVALRTAADDYEREDLSGEHNIRNIH